MYSCKMKKTLLISRNFPLENIYPTPIIEDHDLRKLRKEKDQSKTHSPLQKNDGNGPLTDWHQFFKQLLFIALSIK